MYIYMNTKIIFLYIYISTLCMSRIRHKVYHLIESFPSPTLVAIKRSQFNLLFTHCRKRILGFILFPRVLVPCEI